MNGEKIFDLLDIEPDNEDIKINNEKGDNLTEKRFSQIMRNSVGSFYEHFDIEKYDIRFSCLGDRTRGVGSRYHTPTYVLFINKRYTNEFENYALNFETWKTYWFNIRDIAFRLSENYNENIKQDKEWFAKLKSKTIYEYSTIKELEGVLQKVKKDLFT
jgi:hypothetical protein